LAGQTRSSTFPGSGGSNDEPTNGEFDVFLAVMDLECTSLLESTVIGGEDMDVMPCVCLLSAGGVVLAGTTWSLAFPTSPGGFDDSHNGHGDFFVTRLASPATPVVVQRFRAERVGSGVLVTWLIGDCDGSQRLSLWREGAGAGRGLVRAWVSEWSGPMEFTDASPPAGTRAYWLCLGEPGPGADWHGPAVVPAAEEVRLTLAGCAPNPFNPRTTTQFTLARSGKAEVAVYDQRGRLVKQLASGVQPAGAHSVDWNGTDDRGSTVASGVYIIRLSADSGTRSQRVTLAR
jgi:hypothetical protein